MELTNLIIQYIRDEMLGKLEESEDYKAAKKQKNALEREFIMSLPPKQRRMFHECMKLREELTYIELAHLLKGCTLVVSGEPRPR